MNSRCTRPRVEGWGFEEQSKRSCGQAALRERQRGPWPRIRKNMQQGTTEPSVLVRATQDSERDAAALQPLPTCSHL